MPIRTTRSRQLSPSRYPANERIGEMITLDNDRQEYYQEAYHPREYYPEEYYPEYSDTLVEVQARMVQREMMIQQLTAQLVDESIPTSVISQFIEQLTIYQDISEQDVNTSDQTSGGN